MQASSTVTKKKRLVTLTAQHIYVACGDNTLRRYVAQVKDVTAPPPADSTSTAAAVAAAAVAAAAPSPVLQPPSEAADAAVAQAGARSTQLASYISSCTLFYRDIESPVTAIAHSDGVLALGAHNGSVGLLSTSKDDNRLVPFPQRHEGPVLSVVWLRDDPPGALAVDVPSDAAQVRAGLAIVSPPPCAAIPRRPSFALSIVNAANGDASAPFDSAVAAVPANTSADAEAPAVAPVQQGEQEGQAPVRAVRQHAAVMTLGGDGRVLLWTQLPLFTDAKGALTGSQVRPPLLLCCLRLFVCRK